MNKNELIPYKSSNIFERIIGFFKRLFFNKKRVVDNYEKENTTVINQEITKEKTEKNNFRESILIPEEKKENVDMRLLEKYRNGDIDEEEMTEEQYERICNSYKEKILQLEKSNQKRKEVLLAYRKQMQTSN